MGTAQLRRPSEPVTEFGSERLDALVRDLWDTMAAQHGVGIAAPQIGVGLRIAVFGLDEHPRDPDIPPVPWTVLANPSITPLGEDLEHGWEGCLSIPGMRGVVPRFRRIRYRGFDAAGNAVEREAEGYHARVVQHELDHLDGILYPHRMDNLDTFGFVEELLLPDDTADEG